MASPKLHHVNFKTNRLQEMIDWYGLVVGTTVTHQFPGGAWLTNDDANHRIALLALPGYEDDRNKDRHTGLHHTAFEYGSWMVANLHLRARPRSTGFPFAWDNVIMDSPSLGYVTGVRFYKGAGNTGAHVGSLWTSTGTRLATVTFTNEAATGWQTATFANPIAISANTVYVISYYAPNGHYASTSAYFASTGVDAGPLVDGSDRPDA